MAKSLFLMPPKRQPSKRRPHDEDSTHSAADKEPNLVNDILEGQFTQVQNPKIPDDEEFSIEWDKSDPLHLLNQLSDFYVNNKADLEELNSLDRRINEYSSLHSLVFDLQSAQSTLNELKSELNMSPIKDPKLRYHQSIHFQADIEYMNAKKEVSSLSNEIEELSQKDAALTKRLSIMSQKRSELRQGFLKKQTLMERKQLEKSPSPRKQKLAKKLNQKKRPASELVDYDPDQPVQFNPDKRLKKRLRITNGDWCTVNIANPNYHPPENQETTEQYNIPKYIVKSSFEAEARKSLEFKTV